MSNPGTRFKRGYDPRRGPGGFRAGAGRKPDWLKMACRRVMEEGGDDLGRIAFLAAVVRGEKVKPVSTMQGIVMSECGPREKMEALDRLKEWGYGKTPLPIRATDEDGKTVGGVIILPAQSAGRAGIVVDGRKKSRDR